MDIFLPKKFQESFEVKKIEEKKNEWNIEAVERKERVPKELIGKDIVLNGYERSVEIIDFPFHGKPLYITFFRRKWRDTDTGESYTNDYQFHRPGMKTTDEFGDFLKELSGQERSEYFSAFKDIRCIREEDF